MGIFAVDDLGGLDVAWRIRRELNQFSEPGARKPLVADALVEMNRLGQKTGKGWYQYDGGRDAGSGSGGGERHRAGRPRAPASGAGRSTTRRSGSGRSMRSSTKGRACSRKASRSRAADIDVIYLTGYGFPAFRGGPMFYADQVGSADGSSTAWRRSTASSASGGRRRRCSSGLRTRARRSATTMRGAAGEAGPDRAVRHALCGVGKEASST